MHFIFYVASTIFKKEVKFKPKTSQVLKRNGQELKQALLKDVKSNRQPRPPAFDRIKSFGHDDLTAKRYFMC